MGRCAASWLGHACSSTLMMLSHIHVMQCTYAAQKNSTEQWTTQPRAVPPERSGAGDCAAGAGEGWTSIGKGAASAMAELHSSAQPSPSILKAHGLIKLWHLSKAKSLFT